MPPPDSSRVYLVAGGFLDAIVAAIQDPPARRYVSPHRPPADCAQVTVHVDSVGRGIPGQPQLGPQTPGVAQGAHSILVGRVLRDVPTVKDGGKPPTAQAIDDAAAVILRDLWDLFDTARSLASSLETCDKVATFQATPLQWQGGIGGSEVLVAVQLPA